MEAMQAYDEDSVNLALQLIEECASEGDPLACYFAALWNQSSETRATNSERSAKWLEKLQQLAEQGSATAQWHLGQMYRFGDLVRRNLERANFWIQIAADNGSPDAQHHLGHFYESGQYGFPLDPKASEMWYGRAFAQKHPETLYLFALRKFADGRPTEEAVSLLRQAADLGFKQARDLLRSCLQ